MGNNCFINVVFLFPQGAWSQSSPKSVAVPPPAHRPQRVHQQMSYSNLAICLGPNLLSPANKDLLPLEAMLEGTEKAHCIEQLQ